ncbi:hypothetical protein [Massilia soli]|uniref:Uncharacterized protein n=1 Tax=Massilia soli TaxID=2792854 RepID=A0ABS7SRA3_9BURK|nr:hypothetical protein [Massilia soli]MBZ2208468.1 hypothetical protein [Massilia soli]
MTLSALKPITISTAMVISSTAPENDYPAWTSGATFSNGEFCISPVTHRVYQSQLAGNVNRDPTDIRNRSGAVIYWTDYGPTNRWAMFDAEISTQTTLSVPLTVVMQPGAFTDLYFDGLDASTIAVTVKDSPSGNVVYSYSGSLEGSEPSDYDEYFFDPFSPRTDLLLSGIEQYNSAELTYTLSSSTPVKCGVVAIGSLINFGPVLQGAKAKPKTYSYIKTDDLGVTKIVRRKATTDLSLTALVDRADANRVLSTMEAMLDIPAFWMASSKDDLRGLRRFGLASGELSYDHPTHCILSLTVQGILNG